MRKPKGQSRMDNPVTLATLGAHKPQDEDKQDQAKNKNTTQQRNLER